VGAANEILIIIRDRDKTGSGMKAAEQKAHGFAGTMGKIGTIAGGLLTANLALSVGHKVSEFFGGMMTEAREAEKITASTGQGIKTMGASSWISAQQVEALADKTSQLIGKDDELIQQSANLLLTFGNVKNAGAGLNAIFDRSVVAAQDLSAKGFGSADASAKMLGKALNDPIKGMTALGRAGVTFSEAQKKAIEKMVESGDILGAQKIILAEVERQVGGTAEATATNADKMTTAWSNFQEMLGERVMPIVDDVLNAFTKMTVFLTEHPVLLATLAAVVGGVLVAAFIAWTISASAAAVATIAATWPILAIIVAIVAVGVAIAAAVILFRRHWGSIKDATNDARNWIRAKIADIVDFFRSIPRRIGNLGARIWGGITSGAARAVNAVASFINGMIDKINGLIDAINRIPGVPNIPNIPHVGYVGDRSQPYSVTHLAHGGIAGGLAMINEAGAEAIRLPSGSIVIPHGATRAMLDQAANGATRVVLEFRSSGQSEFDKFMLEWLRNTVRVVGGGDVQVAIGQS
jgi:hypothetical protein